MLEDCLMSDGCPGYDRVLGACLVHPGDCALSPAEGAGAPILEAPATRVSPASAETPAALTSGGLPNAVAKA
jgi:hypothetical protein